VGIAWAAWGSENGLHDRRPVTLQTEACQVWRRSGPQVMAAVNTVGVRLLGQQGERNVAALQRRFADLVDPLLARLRG
jgi:hypothetical protein